MTSEVPTAATPPARPRGAAVLRGVHGVASLRALTTAFETEHGLTLRPDGLTADETSLAGRLVEEKYATAEWLTGPA